MKALVYTGPERFDVRDEPKPEAGPGEVLVRLSGCGICGSDMHAYLGHDARRPAPLILGHEASGVVEAGDLPTGTRVTINPLHTEGTSRFCQEGRDNICPDRQIISMMPRPGAMAEYVVASVQNVVEVPKAFDLLTACLAEPIACGWHAARLAIATYRGDAPRDAMVIGGGAIGVGSALSLQAQGIANVTLTEPNATRRAALSDAPYRVVTPDALSEHDQFDIVIDGVGIAATRASACAQAAPGGVISHIGLGSGEGGVDARRLTLQEITFIGTYTYTAQDFRDTAQAMFDGRLGALDWFDVAPLEQGKSCFDAIRAGTLAPPKTILVP